MNDLYTPKECADGFKDENLAQINVFNYLFACLSGDEIVLDIRAENMALYPYKKDKNYVVARDGKLLKNWEVITIPF